MKIFRNTRKKLVSEKPSITRTANYLKYAIGEIVLVMIGILLALQVNTWNEVRKTKIVEKELLENLLISLQKDSIKVSIIVDYQSKSLENQMLLMHANFKQIKNKYNEEAINRILFQINDGALSFFPKYGLYKMIVANNGFDVLKSKEIKAAIIELYDYKYKRYENIDAVVDQKFSFGLIPFMIKKIDFFTSEDKIEDKVDMKKLENNYTELMTNFKDVYLVTEAGRNILEDIQESINKLIVLIENELK